MPKVHHQPAPVTARMLLAAASRKPTRWSAISGTTYIQLTTSQIQTTSAMIPRNGRWLRMPEADEDRQHDGE